MKTPAPGPTYWRSLEDLGDSTQVRQSLAAPAEGDGEFQNYDPAALVNFGSVGRRRFLKLMGASMALGGLTLTGCRRWPKEVIAPYAHMPKGYVPGQPEYYATAMELGGVASGLLVQSFDGRPIKVEGNPTHPWARTVDPKIGAADTFAQASCLTLYDPDRSRTVIDRTGPEPRASDWAAFEAALAGVTAGGGAGLAILHEAVGGPTALAMKAAVAAKYPAARVFEYEPVGRDNEIAGSKLALGTAARTVLHLDKADVVVCLDADVLGDHPAHIKYAADWVTKRRTADSGTMSRVYAIESAFTPTGTTADYRLPVRPSRVAVMATALAWGLGVADTDPGRITKAEAAVVRKIIADCAANPGRAVVAAGPSLPPEVHALVCSINEKVGTRGPDGTHHYVADPAGDRPAYAVALQQLAASMADGSTTALLVLGGNPAFDAPADVNFARLLARVPFSAHLGYYDDETSALCKWHLPQAHYLETWGDARAWDGLVSVVQPLILPIFGGRSTTEVLATLAGESLADPAAPFTGEPAIGGAGDLVKRVLREMGILQGEGDASDAAFRKALHDGVIPGTGFEVVDAAARVPRVDLPVSRPAPAAGTFEVRFQASPAVYDGRYANNGWLQEAPDPLTKLVWDNAALISVADADAMGVRTQRKSTPMLRIEADGRVLSVPAFVLPGQPQGVIGLTLGYGRTRAGNVGGLGADTVGHDVYPFRTAGAIDVVYGARVTPEVSGATYQLVTTEGHQRLQWDDDAAQVALDERLGHRNRNGLVIREATLAAYLADPNIAHKTGHHGPLSLQLFEPPMHFVEDHAWGMAIDMNSCIGCNACVVACQAENNIPVVGKSEVYKTRAMHWLRIDRYFKGDLDNPDVVNQPLMCVHCENAPCEQVCPVAATVHDTEGLNVMVYNRCIGTRYCSNNCPYKVRRFNFFDWQSRDPRGNPYNSLFLGIPDQQQPTQVDALKKMVFNPDVTVRMRGVMEKCTYCVQRIKGQTQHYKNEWAKGNYTAEQAGQTVRFADGETTRKPYVAPEGAVVTACQQSCPTQAIVFGDLLNLDGTARQGHENRRAYALLDNLNTRPRTKHLAKIRNRDDVPVESAGHGGGHAT